MHLSGDLSWLSASVHIQTKCGENLRILHGILLVPQNFVMDLNIVMSLCGNFRTLQKDDCCANPCGVLQHFTHNNL